MKIKDIFYVKTGRRITQEEVYEHQGDFPCITSQTANKGITWLVNCEWIQKYYADFIIHEECITWTKDGAKCGTMFYRNFSFYPNDHCGVLILKPEYKNKLNLQWFMYNYQAEIYSNVNQQGSQGMLYNEEMAEIIIEDSFPAKEEQDLIVSNILKLKEIRETLEKEIKRINEILDRELVLENVSEFLVSEIALLNKGSNKISEEMIYLNYDKNGIPVYSSATENEGLMGKVKKSYYDSFEKKGNKGELTWTTNGYAGVVFFREGEYLYSEKCGRLVVRRKYKDLVNVKYMGYILNQITYRYRTSESNNGKLDIIHMSDIPVPLPLDVNGNIDIDKQNVIVEYYDKLVQIKKVLTDEVIHIKKIFDFVLK